MLKFMLFESTARWPNRFQERTSLGSKRKCVVEKRRSYGRHLRWCLTLRGKGFCEMQVLSRFGQRGRLVLTTITYLRQRIYQWRIKNQQHRVSLTMSLSSMGCATGGWSSVGTQEQSYSWASQAVPTLSLLTYSFSNYFPPRHSSESLSYLRRKRPWRRGDRFLPMSSYWCGSGCGSWCQPFKVSSAVVFGAAAQLIPSRRLPTASMAYCLGHTFEEILNALTITNETQPAYKYLVLEARHLVDEWNHNTDTKFSPRYISCLDESMMKWVNKYTCPGFMFVPHKPWPFGN